MKNLIFDRTQLDVDNDTEKGQYTYTDLNRIECWCKYIADVLNSYNYYISIDTKTNWKESDYHWSEDLERIRNNVNRLKQAYFSFTQIPANLEYLTWQKANDIEKILFEIDKIIGYMENDFIHCGVPSCGQNRLWQQRFRKPKTWNAQPYKLSQFLDTDTLKMIATDNNIVIENENQEYKSYTLKNIIGDSSFENNNWNDTNNNSAYSTTEKCFGNRSLYFATGTTIVANIEIERPITGHIYYGRRYIKTSGNNTPADCRFEVWGGDGENKNWVYAWNQGDYPEWGFDSAIHKIASVDYPTTDRTIIRCFNVNTTADTWIDGLMIVDLTEAFGTGNEPTKEWCDTNIPYFNGEYILKIPHKTILVQLDKRDDVYASVQAMNDSMQAIDDLSGYECEFHTLKNLCPTISGTNGFNIRSNSGTATGESSTTHTKYSQQALKFNIVDTNTSEVYAISSTSLPLNPEHIYYARIEAYQETKFGAVELYFPIAEPQMFNLATGDVGKWNMYSVVKERSSFTAGNYTFRLDFNRERSTETAGSIWYDGWMIIDLTEAFGSGNEPTQDWCDRNIPYFSGTQTIKIRKEST